MKGTYLYCALLLMLLFVFADTHSVNAQTSKRKRGGGEVNRQSNSRGADPEIKTPKPQANVKDLQAEGFVQSIEKGGKPRGDECYCFCSLGIDNYTGWYLDVYQDGDFRGQVSPWGEIHLSVTPHVHSKIYIVAEFIDGSRLSWGPINSSCTNSFLITVYEESYVYAHD